MMPTPRSLLWISFLLMGAAGSVSADSSTKLAPPGPCAEPRVLAVGIAPSDFSVVGPLTTLLSPIDVAAPPPQITTLVPPSGRPVARPGSCEGGSSCAMMMRPAPRPQAAVTPIPGGTVRK